VSRIDKAHVAPHKRGNGGPRLLERATVHLYRLGAWMIGHLPEGPTRWLVAGAFQVTYVAWPSKRRAVDANVRRILGPDASAVAIRRHALARYRTYARFIVELMRLPRLSDEQAAALVDTSNLAELEADWRERGTGIILTVAHIGSIDAVARGVARHGWPIAGLADDTSFPELFEHLRRQRERWGVRLIPWRSIREVFGVLRRNEILALVVDWGYKPDGIPVRLFGEWTTLPEGPAVLAAKTGVPIVHITIRRTADRRAFHVDHGQPILVASTEPAELARATQLIADQLEATIAAAPDEWYSFKPLWPSDPADGAALEARAAAMATTG
jgi:KDO2-lipid IV(A) lauroyltransferase